MRRSCLHMLLGLASLPGASACAEGELPLRALAEKRGLLIGAAVSEQSIRTDDAYCALLAREYNILTSENRMKFGPIQPVRGQFDWSNADTLVEFCERHGMVVHGHTLLWHGQRPDWLGDDAFFSREEMTEIITTYVNTYVGRYKGRIAIWDVVNEAFVPPSERPDGWRRELPWYRSLGKDYFEMAFRLAHEADPEALLVYNDYGIEVENPKSDVTHRILGEMLKQGVPIHGVGFQFHHRTEELLKPEVIASVERNLQRFADLGLKLYITELDLPILGEKTPEAYQRQAEAYGNIMAAALRQPACKGFQVWGVSDRNSWLDHVMEPKGTSKAPLLFDRDLEPKPAYRALQEALTR